jgi:hypothetical protein
MGYPGMTYQPQYDGYYRMKWHDDEENALKRWFENFKIDKNASFAWETECLVVKEVPAKCKRQTIRYVCEIADEGRGTSRQVVMDHTAPTPPWVFFAAKKKYEPPPPKTAKQLREEEEFYHMTSRGYRPIRRPKRRKMSFADLHQSAVVANQTVEYEIDWVIDNTRFCEPSRPIDNTRFCEPSRPIERMPEPTHRRNV